jgi:hypothetical protein
VRVIVIGMPATGTSRSRKLSWKMPTLFSPEISTVRCTLAVLPAASVALSRRTMGPFSLRVGSSEPRAALMTGLSPVARATNGLVLPSE